MKRHPPKKEGVCDECSGELYQRADDNEETIRHRIDVFKANTQPMVEYYDAQNKLVEMDGAKDPDELIEIVMAKFDEDRTGN